MDSASSSTRKRKRKVLSISEKLKICELAKGGRTLQNLANEFDIGKSTNSKERRATSSLSERSYRW